MTFTKLLKQQAKEDLIRGYPDLTGKTLELKKLPPFSQTEHKSASLHKLTEEEATELEDLKHLYKAKFNFPFVVCVRENTKDSIFQSIRTRLQNNVKDEVEKAIEEICKIAYYRLENKVAKTPLKSHL